MDLKNTFGELVDKLRKARPVIHEITNYVTAESCADAALAAGASPVMADEPEEVIEITAGADALVLNLGTLSFNKQIAMERAAQAAKAKGIPVVLDPVGVMASILTSYAATTANVRRCCWVQPEAVAWTTWSRAPKKAKHCAPPKTLLPNSAAYLLSPARLTTLATASRLLC